MNILDGLKI